MKIICTWSDESLTTSGESSATLKEGNIYTLGETHVHSSECKKLVETGHGVCMKDLTCRFGFTGTTIFAKFSYLSPALNVLYGVEK